MEVKSNAKQVKAELVRETKKLPRKIRAELQRWGNSVIVSAKKHKPYRRRSGNLDRSQQAIVEGVRGVHIKIDPYLVTNNGFNYGKHIHDEDPWLEEEVEKRAGELTDKIASLMAEVFQ